MCLGFDGAGVREMNRKAADIIDKYPNCKEPFTELNKYVGVLPHFGVDNSNPAFCDCGKKLHKNSPSQYCRACENLRGDGH